MIVAQFPPPIEFEFMGSSYGLSFDGVEEDVSAGDQFGFDVGDSFTLSAWISTTDGGTILSRYAYLAPDVGYSLDLDADHVMFKMIASDETAIVVQADAGTLNDGAWHHVLVAYDGSRSASGVAIYVDGALRSDTDVQDDLEVTSSMLNEADFTIGSRDSDAEFFTGSIDEVAVWQSELDAADAEAVYGEHCPGDLRLTVGVAVPDAWWRMGDIDTLPAIADWSGNDIDATAANMDETNIVAGSSGYVQSLDISSPTPSEEFQPDEEIAVSGTVANGGSLTSMQITYDGSTVDVDEYGATTWSHTLIAAQDANTIEVAATYDTGNTVYRSVAIVVDEWDVGVEISAPVTSQQILPGNDITVEATVTTPGHVSTVLVTYNGSSHVPDSFDTETGALEDVFTCAQEVNSIAIDVTYDDEREAGDSVVIDGRQANMTVALPLEDWEFNQGETIDGEGTVTHTSNLVSFTHTYTATLPITPVGETWEKDVVAAGGTETVTVAAEWDNGFSIEIAREGTVIVS